ncbi:hypothetical protein F4815DRAFT_445109 [Daldinia loculata]|nr:hypothetical protein F4815DRAFT_445109 [Daldinia loculata]
MAYQGNYAVGPLPTLVLYGDHHSEVDRAILNILNACVGQSYGSLEDAVVALDNLRPSRRQRGPWETVESETTFFRGFWLTFLKLASQIPCDDTAQGYLVIIVNGLRTLPPPDQSTRNVWRHLPELRGSIKDVWHEPTRHEDDYQVYHQWVNLNAFVARLYNNNLVDCYGPGIRAMRHAFEGNRCRDYMVKTCREKAAAQWMFYSANKLFSLMTTCRPSENDKREHRSREFHGTKVFSFDRWIFWKQAFGDLSVATVDDAAMAVASMDRADGGQRA